MRESYLLLLLVVAAGCVSDPSTMKDVFVTRDFNLAEVSAKLAKELTSGGRSCAVVGDVAELRAALAAIKRS